MVKYFKEKFDEILTEKIDLLFVIEEALSIQEKIILISVVLIC